MKFDIQAYTTYLIFNAFEMLKYGTRNHKNTYNSKLLIYLAFYTLQNLLCWKLDAPKIDTYFPFTKTCLNNNRFVRTGSETFQTCPITI